jgi:hypothetical protein
VKGGTMENMFLNGLLYFHVKLVWNTSTQRNLSNELSKSSVDARVQKLSRRRTTDDGNSGFKKIFNFNFLENYPLNLSLYLHTSKRRQRNYNNTKYQKIALKLKSKCDTVNGVDHACTFCLVTLSSNFDWMMKAKQVF